MTEDRRDGVGSAGAGRTKTGRRAIQALGIGVMTLVTFLIVEGAASILLAWRDARTPEGITHQEYDADLGWVGLASFADPNRWGPGMGLHTNAQRFRVTDTSRVVRRALPAGGRTLCLGDSFAFGQGVDDAMTWCHLLGTGPGPRTVNLGLPGYGIDQTYLRYRSIADSIQHSTVLFTFVADDVNRMMTDVRFGYPKPTLRTSGDSLVIDNVPVPRSGPVRRWFGRYAGQLRVVDLGQRILRRVRGSDPESWAGGPPVPLMRTVRAMFADLQARVRSRGASLVVIYLPTEWDLGEARPARTSVLGIAREFGIPTIDLSDDLRSLPAGAMPGLFIPEGEPASGHYSAAGNRWVAELLRERLLVLSPDRADTIP